MTVIEANKGIFTVNVAKHWITDVSGKIGNDVFVRNITFVGKNFVRAASLFKNEHNQDRIMKIFEDVKNCNIIHIKDSSDGLFVTIRCKSTNLDKAAAQIASKTESMVWLRGINREAVEIIVQSPWHNDLFEKGQKIIRRSGLKMVAEPIMVPSKIEIQIPTQEPTDLEISEEERRIAEKLLISGYYKTPRPPGVTQERICKDLNITKPTLELRMREIESKGIEHILGLKRYSEEDVSLGWETLQTKFA
jgi:predicted DNA binding protein